MQRFRKISLVWRVGRTTLVDYFQWSAAIAGIFINTTNRLVLMITGDVVLQLGEISPHSAVVVGLDLLRRGRAGCRIA
jgi:hypothetical protein